MHSVYEKYAISMRANTLATWLEATVITLAAILLGYLYSPTDPLLIDADFPWLLFAPLLVAVRYGFLPGVFSVGLVLAGVFLNYWMLGTSIPTSYSVGMLLATFLIGEFRDAWYKKIIALQAENQYRQYRLDDFTRSHRLLKVSHDDLELRIAGSSRSLRSALLLVRRALQNTEAAHKHDLSAIAEHAMQIFNQYGAFTSAGLYFFDAQQRLNLDPLVTLGDMPQLTEDDVLLKGCLRNKYTVSVRDELLMQGMNPSKLQVCVPLIDTEHHMVGVLAIAHIPFFSMTEQTLNLLTLLAGYIADALSHKSQFIHLDDPHAQSFSQHLHRANLNTQKHHLNAALIAFEFNDDNLALRQLLEQSQRGLDLQIELVNNRGHYIVLMLLPLTSAQGLNRYLQRINSIVSQEYSGMSLESFNVSIHRLQLDQAKAESLSQFMYQECGLNEQQLAI